MSGHLWAGEVREHGLRRVSPDLVLEVGTAGCSCERGTSSVWGVVWLYRSASTFSSAPTLRFPIVSSRKWRICFDMHVTQC